jgi:Flp pilus assembly CpaF family ATPase
MTTTYEEFLELSGPVLAGYLADDTITDIFCNENGTCFVRRRGQGKVAVAHPGFAALELFLCLMAHEVGTAWRDSAPSMAASLDQFGWRVQADRPPSCHAPQMALRKHPTHVFPLAGMRDQGIFTAAQYDLLVAALDDGFRRLFFTGSVGSSKTTVLNSCLQYLADSGLRVALIEDDPEVLCTVPDCVRKWVVKGTGSLRACVQEALRKGMDMLVIGETRGAEAVDMLTAFATGHGGMTTLHVRSPHKGLLRLETMVRQGSNDPQRELIGEAVDLIVHMERTATSWRCAGMVEVEGWDGQQYVMRTLA